MVERRLPEVNPPSGRVPGRGLLVLPISEARRRRNRGEIAKKGSVLGGFGVRQIYRRRGEAGGHQGVKAPPWRGLGWGRAGWPPGPPCLPYGPSRALLEASCTLIFPVFFPEFFWHFLYGGKLK